MPKGEEKVIVLAQFKKVNALNTTLKPFTRHATDMS
jgi:hypothetical protein